METRAFDMDTDYQMITSWWEKHGWPVVPATSLPQNGLFVGERGYDMAVGFLYCTDSDVSSIEWILSNPEAPLLKRALAVKVLIKELTELAQAIGYGVCMTWLTSRSLKKAFAENEYIKGDENLTHMIKRFY